MYRQRRFFFYIRSVATICKKNPALILPWNDTSNACANPSNTNLSDLVTGHGSASCMGEALFGKMPARSICTRGVRNSIAILVLGGATHPALEIFDNYIQKKRKRVRKILYRT